MKHPSRLDRAALQNGGESEGIRFNAVDQHLNVEAQGAVVEAADDVGVNDGGVEEDIRIRGAGEEGGRIVKAAERRV